MTLPDERYRAVCSTYSFLISLTDPKLTPRVPRTIRTQARSLLRHYPCKYDLDLVSELAPEVFQEKMEPVTKLFKQYEESKNDHN